ncbi:MAG: 23S rRNA (guanosine(2251)-2'-O)-methyltransferase RlmB [Clostridia bacterium]|nr:23S rRNA (guanosine(2251)-2'-O)-methyltransferase RlmB [Clostridia bacterium]
MEDKFEGQIEGRNPVMEALKSDTTIDKIYIQKGDGQGSVIKIRRMAQDKKIPVVEADRRKLDDMSLSHNHQGVIAIVPQVDYVSVEDILKRAEDKGEKPFIVVLDEIEDPHNLGSVIRTANGAGVHGIIIPKHRSAGLTATAAKVAAGACFYTPVAKVTNLARTISELKQKGIWFYGADMAGEKTVFETDFSGGVGIVIGNEGKGISRLVKEECDFLVKIPMLGEIESLNASVSAGIFMYAASKCNRKN